MGNVLLVFGLTCQKKGTRMYTHFNNPLPILRWGEGEEITDYIGTVQLGRGDKILVKLFKRIVIFPCFK